MIKLLLYKWFGIEDFPCGSCEILREQLANSERERRELLHKLLEKDHPEPLIQEKEEFQPIVPQFIPWRVRQQHLEAEDRQAARLMKERKKEIADLEKELGVNNGEETPPTASTGT